jgi:hypothetical protein
MKLKTQAELIAEKLPNLEKKFGAENPYVKGLKEQLVGLERQRDRKEMYSVGTLGPPKKNEAQK